MSHTLMPQGNYKLELLLRDNRVYINYPENPSISVQFKEGKFFQFVHTEEETQQSDFEGDPLEQKEVTFGQFIEEIKQDIISPKKISIKRK